MTLTIDNIGPAPSTPTLVASSDTADPSDMITSITSPTFRGLAEENARVALYAMPSGVAPNLATANLVGQRTASGVHPSAGLGTWEIAAEVLADGVYDFFTVVVDSAGNASAVTAQTAVKTVTIDSQAPQRTTVDLIDDDDPGVSATDNNTLLNELRFRITAVPHTEVTVKNGNTVLETFVMSDTGADTRTYTFDEGAYLLSAASEDTAGNISQQSEQLLVTVDNAAPRICLPNPLDVSDNKTGRATSATTSCCQPCFVWRRSGHVIPSNVTNTEHASANHP